MVTRIKPLYIPENKEEVKEIYYPTWLYLFDYVVERRIFGDIIGKITIVVDGISGRSYLADSFPELEEIKTEEKVLDPSISEEKALEIARDKVETFLFRKFAYLKFSYSLSRKHLAYKLFWAKKKGKSYYLMDSITGDEIEVQKIERSE